MKIVLISNLYPPLDRGGAEQVAQKMAENLQKIGHEVFVFTLGRENKEETINEVKVFRYRAKNLFFYSDDFKNPIWKRLFWHIFDVFNIFSYFEVKNFLKKHQPDLVICHNLKGLGYLTVKAIADLQIKQIYVAHDIQLAVPSGLMYFQKENSFIANGFLTKIYCKICARLFQKVDLVISPSKWLLEFYEKRGFFEKSQKTVLQTPVFLPEAKIENKKRTRKFIYIGQLEKHKGIDWLLSFWDENCKDLILEVVGDGSLRHDLQLKYPKIKFYGKIDAKTILNEFDFLIMPTLVFENAPTVIPLALAFGVPVLVNDLGGSAELIIENKNGFTLQPQNKVQLKSILEKIKNLSDDEYREMSLVAIRSIENLNENEYFSQLNLLLQNL
ncbi:MAG: glycosyltransferase [Patescibacteria group bacterium]